MQTTRNDGRHVWREYHHFRQIEAPRTARSEEEFSPQERDTFDLDTVDFSNAENPDRYTVEPYPAGETTDYRDVDPRF